MTDFWNQLLFTEFTYLGVSSVPLFSSRGVVPIFCCEGGFSHIDLGLGEALRAMLGRMLLRSEALQIVNIRSALWTAFLMVDVHPTWDTTEGLNPYLPMQETFSTSVVPILADFVDIAVKFNELHDISSSP